MQNGGLLAPGCSHYLTRKKKRRATPQEPAGTSQGLGPCPAPDRGAWAVQQRKTGLSWRGALWPPQYSILGRSKKDCGDCGDIEKGGGRRAPLPAPARFAAFANLLRARVEEAYHSHSP